MRYPSKYVLLTDVDDKWNEINNKIASLEIEKQPGSAADPHLGDDRRDAARARHRIDPQRNCTFLFRLFCPARCARREQEFEVRNEPAQDGEPVPQDGTLYRRSRACARRFPNPGAIENRRRAHHRQCPGSHLESRPTRSRFH